MKISFFLLCLCQHDLFDADVRWLNHYGFRPLDMPTLFGGLSA